MLTELHSRCVLFTANIHSYSQHYCCKN